eukprot:6749679-Alexandrium_andersonii.AAC.1
MQCDMDGSLVLIPGLAHGTDAATTTWAQSDRVAGAPPQPPVAPPDGRLAGQEGVYGVVGPFGALRGRYASIRIPATAFILSC